MRRPRLGAGAAALVLALGAAGPLAGCGDDDEDGKDVETPITAKPVEQPEIDPEDPDSPEQPGTDTGGTEAPFVPDDGHEGGGPDPGTEEAEDAAGGTGGSGPEGIGDGGSSPTDAFEQFCEENPRACE